MSRTRRTLALPARATLPLLLALLCVPACSSDPGASADASGGTFSAGGEGNAAGADAGGQGHGGWASGGGASGGAAGSSGGASAGAGASGAPAGGTSGNGSGGDGGSGSGGTATAGSGGSAGAEPTYDCPALPSSCKGAEATTKEHTIAKAEGCEFALKPWSSSKRTTRSQLIDALAKKSGGSMNLSKVLGDLNRVATSGITANNADRMKNHPWQGFRWNSGDMAVSYWYPQGVTGSADAQTGGTVGGKNALLISWYHNSDDRPTKGVRVSLADVTNIKAVKYRHLLLVEPTGTSAAPNFKAVATGSGGALHAGGITWYGDYLYVADTSGGLRVFDTSRVMLVPDTDNSDRIGVSTGRFDALGYRYAIPELTRYTLSSDSCSVLFSFVSLDRSSTPPALFTGEYDASDVSRRLVAWDLDPATHELDVRQGEVRGSAAFVAGQSRMQGALRNQGNVYMSCSSQAGGFGRLYRTRLGRTTSSITAWVYGAEDLYLDRNNLVWTAAEHPNNRDVLGIPLLKP